MTDEDLSSLEAQNQTIEFDIVTRALLDTDKVFPPKLLYRLSNLDRTDLTSLINIWEGIAPQRRLALLEDLENLSEIDFLMSFNGIFKMAISDPEPKVQQVAIRALWECEDPSLITKFIDIIDSNQNIDTQAQAASGLGRFVYLGEVDEISSDRKKQAEQKLMEILEDPSSPDKVMQFALESIGYSTAANVENLIEKGYENGSQEWKRSALTAMGRSAERKWGPFVVENLDSIDEETQLAAIKAAGEIALSEAKPYLLELLEEYNDDVRFAAIWALSEIGGEGILDKIEYLLEESDDDDEIEILEKALENLEFNDDIADFDFFDFSDDDDDYDEEIIRGLTLEKLLSLFSNNLLPIFLTAGAGFIVRKKIDIDPKSISRVIFYLFSPALIFTLLTENQIDGANSLKIVGYAISATVLISIVAWIICRIFKFDRKLTVAVMISVMFTNAGNYGLSLNGFAFGTEALSYASLYFIMSALMIYTFGIALASMGQMSFKESLKRLFTYPTIYAVILALIFNGMGWDLPIPIERSVGLLSDAAIPAMLVLLGMQLSSVDLKADVFALGMANILRLLVAPLMAIGLAVLFKLEGSAYQASILEASMPTAVMTTVLATEFNVRPRFVTSVVTLTTILSPLMLTPLISFLGE